MSELTSLVEKEGKKYPCPYHKNVSTKKVYNSEHEKYIVTCPVCGIIGAIDG